MAELGREVRVGEHLVELVVGRVQKVPLQGAPLAVVLVLVGLTALLVALELVELLVGVLLAVVRVWAKKVPQRRRGGTRSRKT